MIDGSIEQPLIPRMVHSNGAILAGAVKAKWVNFPPYQSERNHFSIAATRNGDTGIMFRNRFVVEKNQR